MFARKMNHTAEAEPRVKARNGHFVVERKQHKGKEREGKEEKGSYFPMPDGDLP